MKVLQFTIPVQHDKTIIAKEDRLPYFYPYLHKHKEIQITWVQRGDGTLVTGSDMHLFQSNDIFVIGANQSHVFKNANSYYSQSNNNAVITLDIFFDPEIICNSLLNIPELKSLKTFLMNTQNGFRVNKDISNAISDKMLLIKELDNGMNRTLHFIELLQLLASVPEPEVLSSDSTTLRNNEVDGIRISEIYNYILHNYERDIKLEDIAQQAYLTPQAFCRFFKKHTGHTFISFLNKVRVNEARKQLSEGNYESISSVAYNCGFNSITNFNRVFKAITQLAPSSYIEKFRRSITPKTGLYALTIN